MSIKSIKSMNVYKFVNSKTEYQVIVAPSLATAETLVSVDYNQVQVLHKDVPFYKEENNG